MYAIKVHSHFNAAHNLRGYRGKCEKLHGHNWKVEVEIAASGLNNLSMVCDFKEVRQRLQRVLKELDHTYLNKLASFKRDNPTSEKIAELIYRSLQRLIKGRRLRLTKVCVWETENSCAVFSEEEA